VQYIFSLFLTTTGWAGLKSQLKSQTATRLRLEANVVDFCSQSRNFSSRLAASRVAASLRVTSTHWWMYLLLQPYSQSHEEGNYICLPQYSSEHEVPLGFSGQCNICNQCECGTDRREKGRFPYYNCEARKCLRDDNRARSLSNQRTTREVGGDRYTYASKSSSCRVWAWTQQEWGDWGSIQARISERTFSRRDCVRTNTG
jgi:hypothetical protein